MNTAEVRVSVIVPAYNVENYIRATLDSLLAQTFSAFEIIVVDDGSSDGTAAAVAAYADPRVVLFRLPQNQGLAAARNAGMRRARGEFIALLDADDVAVPTRLAEQVAALDADPGLGMVGSYVAVMNEAGRLTGTILRRPLAPADVAIGLLFRNTLFAVMAFRQSAIPDGLFRLLPMAEDYDFNARLAARAKVINLDRPLTHYRVRSASLTHTRKQLMEACVREVMRDQLRNLGIEPSARELDLNRHVGALTLPNSPQLLHDVECWLLKLQKANRVTGRYPQQAFDRILSMEWFDVCKFASPLGLHALQAWRTSPLARHWRPPVRERLKFVVKSLLRHRRPGGDLLTAT